MKDTPGVSLTLSKAKGATRNLTAQFLKLKQRADVSGNAVSHDTETDMRIGR